MKKKFLIGTGIFVLFIAAICFWSYNKYLRPDPKINEQLYNQFGSDFFNFPDDQKVTNNVAAGIPDNSGEITGKELNDNLKPLYSTERSEREDIDAESDLVEKSILQNQIVNKYMPQINSLRNTALSRLDTLYSAAVNEYKQRKKEGTLNRSALAQKYIQAGKMLEGNVDSQFENILNKMQTEMIANNFSTDEVSVIRNEYEKAKSMKRSELMANALK
ncbi:MAG: hypothetical protein PHZ11_08225 [Desulfitobacteriaceae bacterium]|nr:hypothetical protein [Desulfitobacteriaceae bacterium]MDD4346854.1 hypothetical protein [Desulfitobacteriaceae bacterium]MDD4402243.1 hypothetical protein [Desulfitobacteriaceae bacterium]